MKKTVYFIIIALLLSLCGCQQTESSQIVATTAPVYQFVSALTEGTDLTVTKLVTENVSCLHDYSLNVRQVKVAAAADVIVISGGGLEDFMSDILDSAKVIDSSTGMALKGCEHQSHEGHDHDLDNHFWLSPAYAKQMVRNICDGLSKEYPQYADHFAGKAAALYVRLDELQAYGESQLADLKCKKLLTFHEGFSYFAEAFDLTILESIEEEAGSEASAQELKRLITMVEEENLPAIFTEVNGSISAANIIAIHTGTEIYELDMGMGALDYFSVMRYNIDTLKEAMG